jgi:hypothetical protein
MQVHVKHEKDGNVREMTVEKDFGSNLEESAKLFGADVIHKIFLDKAKSGLTAVVKSHMEKGKDDPAIVAKVKDWKPAVRGEVTTLSALMKALKIKDLGEISEEQKAELRKILK